MVVVFAAFTIAVPLVAFVQCTPTTIFHIVASASEHASGSSPVQLHQLSFVILRRSY